MIMAVGTNDEMDCQFTTGRVFFTLGLAIHDNLRHHFQRVSIPIGQNRLQFIFGFRHIKANNKSLFDDIMELSAASAAMTIWHIY